MRPVLLVALACACATPAGPKRPDESHRVPVNRTVPPELEGAAGGGRAIGAQREPGRAGEVEWR